MDLRGLDDNKSRFVCPSDRQLALRAKLQTGWSSLQPSGSLDSHEQAAIIAVIKRNEQLETAEQQRVGRLVERLENNKLRAAECGPRFCRLCGQSFGLLGPCKLICDQCKKPMCSKCAIEVRPTKVMPKVIWQCKICSETRELWMKTGAWFYKVMPKYEVPAPRVPQPRTSPAARGLARMTAAQQKEAEAKPIKLRIRCVDTSSEEDESDEAASCASAAGERNFTRDRPSSFLRKHPLFNRKPEPTPPTPPPPPPTLTASTSSIVEWETVSIASRQHLHHQQNSHNNGAANSGSLSRRGSVSSSMSMSETSSANSSNAGGIVVLNCKEPSLGWLELVVSYTEADHTLDCEVVRARDLPAMDAAGLADPFCKVNIVTEYGTAKQKKWYSTRTVHKSVNPEFNETVRFLGVEPEELATSTLYVVVLDDDRYGYDYLGAGRVRLGPVYHADCCRMSIPLEAEDRHSVEAAVSGPWPNGQILVALCYNTRRRALMVLVKRCSNLMARDKNGQSDPFVKLQIKPDAHRNKKCKTSIKWRTLNPVYNEEFVFETRPNELDKQSVLLAVWDKDLGKSNDFLGSLQIGAHSKGRRLKQWKDCIRQPDHFHEQWHYLSNDQSGH